MDINRLIENSMADNGVEVITDTVLHEADEGKMYVGIIVLADATITTIDLEQSTGNTLVGEVLLAGLAIPLRFKSIKISGKAIAVKGA